MKKWKQFGVYFLAVMLICVGIFGINEAKADYNDKIGIVTSTRVSVRKDAKEKASRICYLQNGDTVLIVGENSEWYVVDLSSIGQGQGTGYALKKYINPDAYYIKLVKGVTLWSSPWETEHSNGYKDAGTVMLVLAEDSEWYCVQTCDSTAGSSFIKKSELHDTVNSSSEPTSMRKNYVVVCSTLAVRSEPNDDLKAVGFLHNGDVITVIEYGDYFSAIEYEWAGQITKCWVHSEHIKEIIN